eukprot:349949-Chlamydomonas_euryale.AAC.1
MPCADGVRAVLAAVGPRLPGGTATRKGLARGSAAAARLRCRSAARSCGAAARGAGCVRRRCAAASAHGTAEAARWDPGGRGTRQRVGTSSSDDGGGDWREGGGGGCSVAPAAAAGAARRCRRDTGSGGAAAAHGEGARRPAVRVLKQELLAHAVLKQEPLVKGAGARAAWSPCTSVQFSVAAVQQQQCGGSSTEHTSSGMVCQEAALKPVLSPTAHPFAHSRMDTAWGLALRRGLVGACERMCALMGFVWRICVLRFLGTFEVPLGTFAVFLGMFEVPGGCALPGSAAKQPRA